MDVLRAVSTSHIESLRRQVQFIWRTYFSSLRVITLTTLQIINDRVFPYTALKYEHWNDPPTNVRTPAFLHLVVIHCVVRLSLGYIPSLH